jgi:hypothetical protein
VTLILSGYNVTHRGFYCMLVEGSSVNRKRFQSGTYVLAPFVGILCLGIIVRGQLPTTLVDFSLPGTQPNQLNIFMVESQICGYCHGDYDVNQEPYSRWTASLMAQSARDPVFFACLAIANQDAAFSGDLCLRCHAPIGWLEGRSTPTTGAALTSKDRDGVSCHVCHRMVDPIYDPLNNPPDDEAILAGLAQAPTNPHSGTYVIDPQDRRRASFDLDPNFFYHEWRRSPYHRESLLCGTCHDVSNPVLSRQPDGSYAPNALNTPPPSLSKFEQFPLERTYSEWQVSAFAAGPIEMGGRFGGNISAVSSCQDCHMPKTTGTACVPDLNGAIRSDLPLHNFNGANTWVLNAIRSLYPDTVSKLNDDSVAAALDRTFQMLAAASDAELEQFGDRIRVRVVNQTGHKLPTGYPEGRRMWVNVLFYDRNNALIAERGAYDTATADLSVDDTKVYEAKLGVDAVMSAITGLPVGETFHFALNNKWYLDNRIPPRGFTNAAFASVQAAPVNYVYADGQHWDDTFYVIPPSARSARVRVFFQTTTKEYIEFLRDANTTNLAGQTAYNQWLLHGKSAPALMDDVQSPLHIPGDIDLDGDVDLVDLATVLAAFGGTLPDDVDGDGDVDLADLSILLTNFGTHD